MVELQALGAVGGEQKQSPLFPVYLASPLGQPLDEVVDGRLSAAGFQNVFGNAFLEQFDLGTGGLVVDPIVEVGGGYQVAFPSVQPVQQGTGLP